MTKKPHSSKTKLLGCTLVLIMLVLSTASCGSPNSATGSESGFGGSGTDAQREHDAGDDLTDDPEGSGA